VVEFKRILCPVDLSEPSARALAYAGALASWYDAQLTVLHVVPTFEPVDVRAGALFDPVTVVQPVPREAVIDQLQQSAAAAGIEVSRAVFAAEAGEAAPTIVDQAVVHHADLVVIGTHGRSGFDRFLVGSVTARVLRNSVCPVLTVPPHAPQAPPSDVGGRGVLCPVDFSPASLQAFGFARDLAGRSDTRLTVLHVIEWLAEEEPRELVHFSVPEYRQYLLDDARERLQALVSQEAALARGTDAKVVVGRAHRQILQVESDTSAGLIVMGARGRGGPLFGSSTEQVVRGASCPVLTVHEPLSAS
jgi:nucleotide-binding universal stress UspA family protein